MNLRSWMMLVFLLSAGTSLAQVNWLTGIVKSITTHVRSQYNVGGQYCLAVSIPENQDPNTLHNILPGRNDVQKVLNGNQVYKSSRIIIATPEREGEVVEEHAEPRVLKELDELSGNNDDFLLIYSYLSPCRKKCTNLNDDDNILKYFEDLPTWVTNYAFVFTEVYNQPTGGRPFTPQQLKGALRNLGESVRGHIYRCFGPNDSFQCYSCMSGGNVLDVCVDNNFVPGQGGSSSSYNIKRPRDSSPSASSSSSSYNINIKKPRSWSPRG